MPITRADARARLGIPENAFVLGVFGGMHISRRLDWVRDAAQALRASGREVLVLHIGPDAEAIRTLLGSFPLIADGPLPEAEVSRRFAAMDVNLTPFIDGVSTRRGSLMTGLQHGTATVGTLGQHTDTILRDASGIALLLSKVAAPEQFVASVLRLAQDPALRDSLGQGGQRLYDQNFAWSSLSRQLHRVLAAASEPK